MARPLRSGQPPPPPLIKLAFLVCFYFLVEFNSLPCDGAYDGFVKVLCGLTLWLVAGDKLTKHTIKSYSETRKKKKINLYEKITH